MNKNLIVLVFTMLLMSLVSGIMVYTLSENVNEKSVNYVEVRADSPIRINSDTELTNAATANGWPGDGSAGNPYMIENYHIDVGTAENGLYLGNTTLYVIVNSTEVYNVSGSTGNSGEGAAIALVNVHNVGLYDNYIHESNYYGIFVSGSSDVEIEGNTVTNNSMVSSSYGVYVDSSSYIDIVNNSLYNENIHSIGIYVHSSQYTYISDNKITRFRNGAIDISYSTYSTLFNNSMYNCSIRVEGNTIAHYNNAIPTNNTVNNEPVYYYNDTDFGNTYLNLPENVGELILNNISNLVVTNLQTEYTSISFLVSFSHHVNFNNILSLNSGFHSISLGMSDNITISNSSFTGSGATGIYVYMVNDLSILNTKTEYSTSNGIYAYYTYRITIFNVSVMHNYYGFYVYNSYYEKAQYVSVENSRFENNTNYIARFNYALNVMINNSKFANNAGSGIELYGFNDNSEITNNTIMNNGGYGIYSSHAKDVDIKNNTIEHSGGDGIYIQYQGDAYVVNNYIDDSYGLVLNGVNNSFFLNNTIKNSKYYGIEVHGNSAKIGGNLFWGNIVENSSSYGVYLNSTEKNILYNNSFKYNNGTTNTYNHQHIQAYDDTGNVWNTSGSPHGYGNYWADWTTPDNDGDGIVDNSYVIDGGAGAQDHYPLASSPSIPEFSGMWLLLILLVFAVIVLLQRR